MPLSFWFLPITLPSFIPPSFPSFIFALSCSLCLCICLCLSRSPSAHLIQWWKQTTEVVTSHFLLLFEKVSCCLLLYMSGLRTHKPPGLLVSSIIFLRGHWDYIMEYAYSADLHSDPHACVTWALPTQSSLQGSHSFLNPSHSLRWIFMYHFSESSSSRVPNGLHVTEAHGQYSILHSTHSTILCHVTVDCTLFIKNTFWGEDSIILPSCFLFFHYIHFLNKYRNLSNSGPESLLYFNIFL